MTDIGRHYGGPAPYERTRATPVRLEDRPGRRGRVGRHNGVHCVKFERQRALAPPWAAVLPWRTWQQAAQGPEPGRPDGSGARELSDHREPGRA